MRVVVMVRQEQLAFAVVAPPTSVLWTIVPAHCEVKTSAAWFKDTMNFGYEWESGSCPLMQQAGIADVKKYSVLDERFCTHGDGAGRSLTGPRAGWLRRRAVSILELLSMSMHYVDTVATPKKEKCVRCRRGHLVDRSDDKRNLGTVFAVATC
jgi:hypothetical protein